MRSEFFVAGITELDAFRAPKQGLVVVFSVPELGMIGVAGYAGYPALLVKRHVDWNGHGRHYICRVGKAVCATGIVAGKGFVAAPADAANLFRVGEFVPIKGECKVTIQAFCVSGIVVNG